MNSQDPPGSRPAPARSQSTARRRRRTRLRTTAGPTARGTAKATRGGREAETPVTPRLSTVSSSSRCTTVTGPLTSRRPRRCRAAKVARSRTRWIRPIAGPGRGGDGPAGCGGRPWWTCGDGTRVVGPAGGCWVGRSSSRTASCAALAPRTSMPGRGTPPRAAPPPAGGELGRGRPVGHAHHARRQPHEPSTLDASPRQRQPRPRR